MCECGGMGVGMWGSEWGVGDGCGVGGSVDEWGDGCVGECLCVRVLMGG